MQSTSRRAAFAALILLACAPAAAARDLHVPENHRSIRRALRVARPGDRVLVAPGNYRESVTCRTRDVTVQGVGAVWEAKRRGAALRILADGVTVRGFTFTRAGVRVRGDRVNVSGNAFAAIRAAPALSIRGRAARVADNVLRSVVLGRQGGAALDVRGDGAVVSGNELGGLAAWPARTRRPHGAIAVAGDGARVIGNGVRATPDGFAVAIEGASAVVDANSLEDLADGIRIRGPAAEVSGNSIGQVARTALEVLGNGAVVHANSLADVARGVRVEGARAQVLRNQLRGGAGDGIAVRGERAEIRDNEVLSRLGNDITVIGDGFAVVGNRSAPAEGFDVEFLLRIGAGDRGFSAPESDAPDCPALIAETTSSAGAGVVRENEIVHVIGSGIHVRGARVDVVENEIVGNSVAARSAIVAEGREHLVARNRLFVVAGFAIDVSGDRHTIRGNEGTTSARRTDLALAAGIRAVGRETQIDGNRIDAATGFALLVQGGANSIRGNQFVDTIAAPGRAVLQVSGADNVVSDNVLERVSGHGIAIAGDRNELVRNVVEGATVTRGSGVSHPPAAHGIRIDGTDNRLVDNGVQDVGENGFQIDAGARNVLRGAVADRCGASAFCLLGGVGHTLDGCESTDAGEHGLENRAEETRVIDGAFVGSRAGDVRNVGTFAVFERVVIGDR